MLIVLGAKHFLHIVFCSELEVMVLQEESQQPSNQPQNFEDPQKFLSFDEKAIPSKQVICSFYVKPYRFCVSCIQPFPKSYFFTAGRMDDRFVYRQQVAHCGLCYGLRSFRHVLSAPSAVHHLGHLGCIKDSRKYQRTHEKLEERLRLEFLRRSKATEHNNKV